VLLLNDGKVIDESIEIIEWCIKKKKDIFKDTLNKDQELFAEDAIKLFDEKFKFHLDRYKYATRYKDVDEISHRESCVEILKSIEKKISNKNFFYTNHVNKIDICILPFIRQFRIANPEWFDHHNEFPKIQKWLDNFLKSSILEEIMVSHEVWKKNNPAIFFPTNL
jgi:glutathione S-transferase